MHLTNNEIAQHVRRKLDQDNMTLSKCCDDFNSKYSTEIATNVTKPLNKDFLSRVSRNQFKVCTTRVLKLCEFLNIPSTESAPNPLEVLSEQIAQFREELNKDDQLRKKFATIERFLSGLNLQELRDVH